MIHVKSVCTSMISLFYLIINGGLNRTFDGFFRYSYVLFAFVIFSSSTNPSLMSCATATRSSYNRRKANKKLCGKQTASKSVAWIFLFMPSFRFVFHPKNIRVFKYFSCFFFLFFASFQTIFILQWASYLLFVFNFQRAKKSTRMTSYKTNTSCLSFFTTFFYSFALHSP